MQAGVVRCAVVSWWEVQKPLVCIAQKGGGQELSWHGCETRCICNKVKAWIAHGAQTEHRSPSQEGLEGSHARDSAPELDLEAGGGSYACGPEERSTKTVSSKAIHPFSQGLADTYYEAGGGLGMHSFWVSL